MTDTLTRRDFVTAASAVAGFALWPAGRTADRAPARTADGTGVLFQGDSITDCGRDRKLSDPNAASALGSGYPLLVAAAALAAHPDRALRFYNRGVSGNKVPDLAARWATETLALAPDVLSILIGVNDFWHKLSSGYTGTVEDYEHQYTALLEDTRRALPRPRIIVLEPFVHDAPGARQGAPGILEQGRVLVLEVLDGAGVAAAQLVPEVVHADQDAQHVRR